MNVRLVVEQGARRRVMNLRPPEALIGRAHGNTVRIPSAEVSRRHCRLMLEDGLVRIEDLESVNGTFLNGRKIRGTEYVRPGDQVDVGPVTFVVEYVLTPDALARLNGNDDPEQMLEMLADGDVVEGDEGLIALEPLEDEGLALLEPVVEGEDLPMVSPMDEMELSEIPEGEELVSGDFDDGSWQLPVGNDFRDMLSQLEDDPTHHEKPKKKKR